MAPIKWDSWREIEDMFENSPYKTVKVWINLFDFNYRTFHQSLRQGLTNVQRQQGKVASRDPLTGRPFKFKGCY